MLSACAFCHVWGKNFPHVRRKFEFFWENSREIFWVAKRSDSGARGGEKRKLWVALEREKFVFAVSDFLKLKIHFCATKSSLWSLNFTSAPQKARFGAQISLLHHKKLALGPKKILSAWASQICSFLREISKQKDEETFFNFSYRFIARSELKGHQNRVQV